MTMKVKELIEKLKELDQEAKVVISGYEGGVKEVTTSQLVTIALNVNDEWYYGEHELLTPHFNEYTDYSKEKAVYIH